MCLAVFLFLSSITPETVKIVTVLYVNGGWSYIFDPAIVYLN
jgi:hypothetical protein